MSNAPSTRNPTFLTAEWRNLAMINYECDPSVLAPRVPAGTELDSWNGSTFISMVGFQFLNTRVLGMPLPLHRDFEEVNLRFYVRHKSAGEWRRGVVFVRELVPRPAIAWVARTVYEEPYLSVPMSHRIQETDCGGRSVQYSWRFEKRDHFMKLETDPEIQDLEAESHAEFIAEHYWGYTARRDGRTSEYEVVHPRWKIQQATHSEFSCEVSRLYGDSFRESLASEPSSAFLALGSPISVQRGSTLKP